MKEFLRLPLLIFLWAIIRILIMISSLFVRFIYKKDHVYLYNGCNDLTIYRVKHVPIFGSPTFTIVHLSTNSGEDDDDDRIVYSWNSKHENYYQVHKYLKKIPYNEYEPIEKQIQNTEQQISNLLKNAAANSNHPLEFLPGMNLWDEKGSVFQLNEPQEESNSWLADCISINESLPLIEQKGGYIFENEDKSDYVVITKAVFEQIRTIGKDRHIIIQKELLAIKDRYKATVLRENVNPRIIYPWGIFGKG